MFCHIYYYNEIHDTVVVRQTKGMEGMSMFCLFSSEPKQCKNKYGGTSDNETKNSRYKADSTEKSPGENIMKFSASEDSHKAPD